MSVLLAPDLAGRALDDRYELHVIIGEGAFGRVYRGFDRRLARTVAVKVIKPWWAEDGAWVERFKREAQLLARVNDPGIVQIFDFGHAEEGPYYVAELVEGESLAQRLRRPPVSVAEARAVAEQLCRALGSAHAQGVLHCDVKPANVLLADGEQAIKVKVGDFGVARFAEGTSQAISATVAGTPRYMSPEQARGRPTTSATDVYSAGVVLYEMLAGEPPFAGGSPVELGLHHLQDQPPPLPARVPPPLREVVAKALAKDPVDRYHDGTAMAVALRAADSPMAVQAPTPQTAREDRGAAADDRAAGAAAIALMSERETIDPAAAASAMQEPETIDLAAAASAMQEPETIDPAAAASAMQEPETIDLAAATTRLAAPTRVPARTPPAMPPRPPRRRVHASAHRRRRIAWIAGAAALAVCALLAFLLIGAAARTKVPELRGLPRGGVEARARRTHVRPAFSTHYSQTAAGIAIAQHPAAGTSVAAGSSVGVVLSAGPPPVSVPDVVGRPSASAERALAGTGLHYDVTLVAAPGSQADTVMRQSPRPPATVPHGSTVALSVAEAPRWRPLTRFSGVDNGRSVIFRIRGSQWKVSYSMSYQGTCLLLLVCLGPSAAVHNIQTDSSFGGFELGEGSSQTQTFHSGPGLYRVDVSGGHDSARWSMAVADYY